MRTVDDDAQVLDLLVVGGGINGVGVARDAAGRGLATMLVERDDLASATSQWSTKLIHGGLRYLEHYEFRLVGESLAEREVLLAQAPHLIEPLRFVLPHEPHLRPAWMIRAGLFLYDRIGGRVSLPRSQAVPLRGERWGAGLQPRLERGFVYADARVDDARLVVATALGARAKGAQVLTRTTFSRAVRERRLWRATIVDESGIAREVRVRALVNASGPWVGAVLDATGVRSSARVRHVKGSHIVVPRVHDEPHAYLLQNVDKRIVFVIPYQHRFSLIGTTDVAVTDYESPKISVEEIDYLVDLANRYLAQPISRGDVVWSYSGVRPLYDDGESELSAITRDYTLKVDAGADGRAPPVLSIYGGKLTTYRKLSDAVMNELKPYFPSMPGAWTASEPLPGGDIPSHDRGSYIDQVTKRHAGLPAPLVEGLVKRHGTLVERVLGDARRPSDLGRSFVDDLCEREVAYMLDHEWAKSADDVLWRRSKYGLFATDRQRAEVASFVGA